MASLGRFAGATLTLTLALSCPRIAWCSPTEPTKAAEPMEPTNDVEAPTGMRRFRGELELGAFLATPFEGDGGGPGIGWRIGFGVGWDRIPLTFGLAFQSAYFGESTSDDVVAVRGGQLEIEKARTDRVLFADVFARLQPLWPVRPFVEGILGTKRVRTEYEASPTPSTAPTGWAGSTETDDDWTYTLGIGAGIDVPLSSRLWLTGGVRHLLGGQSRYDQIIAAESDTRVHYDTSTTTTTFTLGLVGRFSRATEGG